LKSPLTDLNLDFSQDNLFVLNLALAFIMFGVSLSIRRSSFKEIMRNPSAVLTGVASQFLLLPFLTFLLVYLIQPLEGLALGMILVAACPGGNVSNFFSQVSKGNVALSVSLTAIATIAASVMTPLNFQFWSSLYLGDKLSVAVNIDPFQMFKIVLLVLVVPLFLGVWFSHKFPVITKAISLPIRIVSFLILIGFILLAFMKNINLFTRYYKYIIYLVFIHNAVALLSGYFLSKIVGNSEQDSRTISIETGIQNSGLGLVIIFTLFQGNGGMALITAWWGIWHIIAGMIISILFSKGAIFDLKTS